MPGRSLLIPVFVIFLLLLGYGLFYGEVQVYILIPFLILTIGLYLLQYKINEYWLYKHPPELNPYEEKWCEDFLPYYTLSGDKKIEFKSLLARELLLKEFILMGLEKIPEECKIMCLAPAVRLGIARQEETIKNFNRIVIYPHPFMTPNMDYIHISEHHEEDGVLIFSLEQLYGAHTNPKNYFNPALYEWSAIFSKLHLLRYDAMIERFTERCNELFGKEEDYIKSYFGLTNLNWEAMMVYAFVMNEEGLKEIFPEVYRSLEQII